MGEKSKFKTKSRNGSFQETRRSKFTFSCSIPLWLCNFVLKKSSARIYSEKGKNHVKPNPWTFSSRTVRKGQFLQLHFAPRPPPFLFLFSVLFSYLLFCFCFPLWVGGFVQTELPLWMVSVSTNCHSVTPRQISTLENSQPPLVCSLEHIWFPNPRPWTKPSTGVTPLTPGRPLCKGPWPRVPGR